MTEESYDPEILPAEEVERLRRTPPQVIRTDLVCPDCGSMFVLKVGVYGRFYGCKTFPRCRGAVSADPLGVPRGDPADAETRRLRQQLLTAMTEVRKIEDGLKSLKKVKTLRAILRTVLGRRSLSTGFLTRAECEKAIGYLCRKTPGLREVLDGTPGPSTPRNKYERLMDDNDPLELALYPRDLV